MPFSSGRPLAEAKAELFKALAHPVRVRVLELLAGGDLTMGELAERTGFEPSHLSQHVTQLRRAGIVDSRRVRTTVLCTLRDPQTAELLAVALQLIGNNLRHAQVLLGALEGADDADTLAGADRPSA